MNLEEFQMMNLLAASLSGRNVYIPSRFGRPHYASRGCKRTTTAAQQKRDKIKRKNKGR